MTTDVPPRAPRAPGAIRARVLSPRSAGGTALNVSESGMLFEIERAAVVPVGQDIQIQFQLPNAPKSITTRASVVRHEGRTRMGLRFVMMSSDDLAIIQAYVSQNPPA